MPILWILPVYSHGSRKVYYIVTGVSVTLLYIKFILLEWNYLILWNNGNFIRFMLGIRFGNKLIVLSRKFDLCKKLAKGVGVGQFLNIDFYFNGFNNQSNNKSQFYFPNNELSQSLDIVHQRFRFRGIWKLRYPTYFLIRPTRMRWLKLKFALKFYRKTHDKKIFWE